jgi:hypothetical protein
MRGLVSIPQAANPFGKIGHTRNDYTNKGAAQSFERLPKPSTPLSLPDSDYCRECTVVSGEKSFGNIRH